MSKKRKERKVIKHFNFGIFPGYVSFCYNMKYDEIIREYEKQKQEVWLAGILGEEKLINGGSWLALSRELVHEKTKDVKKLFYIIVPREFDFSDHDYAKLAHEITHICQFYLPKIGRAHV